ncbi:MAG: TolC family protein [Bacteroidia bacterium]|nr:TolC family protein [Bacteroidia bacterium]
MRHIAFLLFLTGAFLSSSYAQTLSLEACLASARASSPILEQAQYTTLIGIQEDENLSLQWRPTIGINAQGTYQSDVITFPENSPLGNLPSLPKAQYRATLDVQQVLYEGGAIKQSRLLNGMQRNIEVGQAEASLAQVERSITELYFGVLEADEQAKSLLSSVEYLRLRRGNLQAAIRNGVMLSSELARYDQEILRLQQQIDLLHGQAQAFKAALAVQVGDPDLMSMTLTRPVSAELPNAPRPELELFNLQQGLIYAQSDLLDVQKLPKISAFATGGLGQPNPYNFINTDLSGFYMVGLRLSWSPFDWGMREGKQQVLRLKHSMVGQQRSLFELQQNTELARIDQQILTLSSFADQDDQLIALQEEVVARAESQLDNGTITTTDYLREVQTLTRNRLSKELHGLQLSKLQVQRSQVE